MYGSKLLIFYASQASDSGSDGSNPERKRPAPIPVCISLLSLGFYRVN